MLLVEVLLGCTGLMLAAVPATSAQSLARILPAGTGRYGVLPFCPASAAENTGSQLAKLIPLIPSPCSATGDSRPSELRSFPGREASEALGSGAFSWRKQKAGIAEAGARPARTDSLDFNGQRAFEDMKRIVAFGPRPPGSKALEESRQWIISQLKHDGCEVEQDSFVASTPVGQIPMTNLIAKIPGARPGVVMVAGHYDTKRFESGSFVGANDGGSSTALPLELARLLCRRKNPVTYWLVFFDGEEALLQWSDADKLYGSRHLVQKLSASGELSRLKAMILVDMIADARLDIRRENNSAPWLNDIVFNTAHRLGYSKYFLDDSTAVDDDHIPFVDAGVSAVDIIDLDYGPPGNSYHHTLKDTLDKCSPTSLNIVGHVVAASLEELENSPRVKP